MIWVSGGRGLAYTRESERDMEPVAAADRKRPDISKEKNLEEGKRKREKEKDFFIFCLKIRPFEAKFFCDGEKTL